MQRSRVRVIEVRVQRVQRVPVGAGTCRHVQRVQGQGRARLVHLVQSLLLVLLDGEVLHGQLVLAERQLILVELAVELLAGEGAG